MKRLLMLAAASTMILTACSDDSTTNPDGDTGTYVPSKTGAYVIHANKETNEGVTTDVSDDSTVVIGTLSIKDDANVTKTSVRHEVYIDGSVSDTIDVAQEGSKIFLNFPLELGDIEGVENTSYGTRWIQIGDVNASTWTGLSLDTNVTIDYSGVPLPATISFRVNGKKIGTENMTISGTSVSCVKFENTFDITISVPAFSINIPLSLKQTVWLGKNVGLVKQSQPETVIELADPIPDMVIPGFESTAIRYGGQ